MSVTTSKRVAFDTNLLLRWILQDEAEQAKAVLALVRDPQVREIQVADMALAEVVWVLLSPRLGFSRAQIVELLDIVLLCSKINCNRALLNQVLPLFVRSPALSFVDICLSGYASLNGNVPLMTFDHKLARQLPQAQLVTIPSKT